MGDFLACCIRYSTFWLLFTLFFYDATYKRRDKKKSKMGSIGCASPIEEEQLCETKLAMDHFGSFP